MKNYNETLYMQNVLLLRDMSFHENANLHRKQITFLNKAYLPYFIAKLVYSFIYICY